MTIHAYLIYRSGIHTGEEKEITTNLLRIGRDPANDFVVDDIEVSRNHVKITCIEDDFRIEDLNSTNGTYLNGRKISTSEKLKNGDLIRLGESNVFEFSAAKDDQKDESLPVFENDTKDNEHKGFFSKRHDKLNSEILEVPDDALAEKNDLFKGLSKLPTWAVVLLVALGFIILFCIIPMIFIELSNQWCNLFSGFFNAISPGICP